MRCSKGSDKGGKFMAMGTYIKKKSQETREISNSIMVHLKSLEKQEQIKPQISRWKEMMLEINEIATKSYIRNQ
jgi:hypothetical protein